jgi:hypothetical protein
MFDNAEWREGGVPPIEQLMRYTAVGEDTWRLPVNYFNTTYLCHIAGIRALSEFICLYVDVSGGILFCCNVANMIGHLSIFLSTSEHRVASMDTLPQTTVTTLQDMTDIVASVTTSLQQQSQPTGDASDDDDDDDIYE